MSIELGGESGFHLTLYWDKKFGSYGILVEGYDWRRHPIHGELTKNSRQGSEVPEGGRIGHEGAPKRRRH